MDVIFVASWAADTWFCESSLGLCLFSWFGILNRLWIWASRLRKFQNWKELLSCICLWFLQVPPELIGNDSENSWETVKTSIKNMTDECGFLLIPYFQVSQHFLLVIKYFDVFLFPELLTLLVNRVHTVNELFFWELPFEEIGRKKKGIFLLADCQSRVWLKASLFCFLTRLRETLGQQKLMKKHFQTV